MFFLLTNYSEFGYFTDETTEFMMLHSSYENKLEESKRITNPTIQSNVISKGFLELFIPYNIKDNEWFQKKFPDVKPFKKIGLRLSLSFNTTSNKDSLNTKLTDDERSKIILNAFKEFYLISIDDSLYYNYNFYFYEHPNADEPGFFTIISIDNLKVGNHLLKIEKNLVSDSLENGNKPYYIPFWVN